VEHWSNQLLLLGLATARFSVAFVILPLFAQDTVPALVRNSICVTLALICLVVLPPISISQMGPGDLLALYAKEAFVGLIIGLFFGSVVWALEAAGQIIDGQVGASLAQVIDPLTGHQTSLHGALLGRLASVVFVFAGGLSLIVKVVLESYAVWPITAPLPRLTTQGLAVFEGEFGRLMVLATLFAAPVLIVLFLIDASLGLVNRFAQQLNVFTLSLSIKSFAATAVILLLTGSYVGAVVREVTSRPNLLLGFLKGLAQ
jgi:type III secretion protein T